MAKDWAYAKKVKEMAEVGGPDVWVNSIIESAYNKGASDIKNTLVVPLLLTGVALGSICVIGYQKIKKRISDKKEAQQLTEKEALQAEAFLKKELDTAIEENDADNKSNETKRNIN